MFLKLRALVGLVLLSQVLAACVGALPAAPSPAAPAHTPIPDVPVGRAVTGDEPRFDDVRVSGRLVFPGASPASYICVTIGPRPRCVVQTDARGDFVVDIPQGAFQWTFRFMRDGREVAPAITLRGPFSSSTVSIGHLGVEER